MSPSWPSNLITHTPLRASHTRAVRSQLCTRAYGEGGIIMLQSRVWVIIKRIYVHILHMYILLLYLSKNWQICIITWYFLTPEANTVYGSLGFKANLEQYTRRRGVGLVCKQCTSLISHPSTSSLCPWNDLTGSFCSISHRAHVVSALDVSSCWSDPKKATCVTYLECSCRLIRGMVIRATCPSPLNRSSTLYTEHRLSNPLYK